MTDSEQHSSPRSFGGAKQTSGWFSLPYLMLYAALVLPPLFGLLLLTPLVLWVIVGPKTNIVDF